MPPHSHEIISLIIISQEGTNAILLIINNHQQSSLASASSSILQPMNKYSSFDKPQQSLQYHSDRKAKILLIGNAGVGKSSILLQFSDNKFMHSYYNTIGVDYKIKYLTHQDKTVKLQIWDTAGQDRFKTITSSYYRGADAIAVIYDITDRASFLNVKNWLDQISKYSDEKAVRFIVGNKNDLEEKRQVTSKQALEFANQIGLPFRETSARFSADVDGLFEAIVEKLGYLKAEEEKETASKTYIEASHRPKLQQQSLISLKPQKKKEKTHRKCCNGT